jgi:hypothetical protein
MSAPSRGWGGSTSKPRSGRKATPVGRYTYSKLGFAKLYDRKTALTAADLLNDRVIPFFEEHGLRIDRVLTDRGTEFCGAHDRHEYELYLAVENIDHTRTRTKNPQTNGICERFHKTLLEEFYRIAFRRKLYTSIAELQTDRKSCCFAPDVMPCHA